MDGVSLQARTGLGIDTLCWYLDAELDDAQALAYAKVTGTVVVRGRNGVIQARRLQACGFTGDVILDPAVYEQVDGETEDARSPLFEVPIDWVDLQQRLACPVVLSSGAYVSTEDSLEVALAEAEDEIGDLENGVPFIALHWRWLTDRIDELVMAATELKGPLAVAFADTHDPIGHSGATSGLARLSASASGLMIVRSDLAGLAALAHGAEFSAVGTIPSMRRVVPPGQTGGGAPGRPAPSALIERMFDWTRVDYLEGLGHADEEGLLACEREACNGASVARFNNDAHQQSLGDHNRHVLAALADQVLMCAPSERPAVLRSLAREAFGFAAQLSAALNRPVSPSRQVEGWAEV